MRVYSQWHTHPQDPLIKKSVDVEAETARSLHELVPSDQPLYACIKNAYANNNLRLTTTERNWLSDVINQFDQYVTGLLIYSRTPEWPELDDDYKSIYGQRPSKEDNRKKVMARVVTLGEVQMIMRSIEKQQNEYHSSSNAASSLNLDFLMRPRIPDRLYRTDCSGNREYWHTGTNQQQPTIAGGQVGALDPTNHWGIMVDTEGPRKYAARLGYSRVRMACCGELVDHTAGCWISLAANQVVGEVVPYILMPVDPWPKLAADDSYNFDLASQIGTAFQDARKYMALHNEIKKIWSNLEQLIRNAYKTYMRALDDVIADEKPLYFNPTMKHIEPPELFTIISVMRLVFEYNKMHCGDTFPASLDEWRAYIDQTLFKVGSISAVWTDDARGGLPIIDANGKRVRVRLFHTQRLATETETKDKLDVLVQSNKYDALKGIIQYFREEIVEIGYALATYNKIMMITQKHRSAVMTTFVAAYEQGKNSLMVDQLHINALMKTLRSGGIPTYFDVTQIQLTYPDDNELKKAEFDVECDNAQAHVNAIVANVTEPWPLLDTSPAETNPLTSARYAVVLDTFQDVRYSGTLLQQAHGDKFSSNLFRKYAEAVDGAYALYLQSIAVLQQSLRVEYVNLSKIAMRYDAIVNNASDDDVKTKLLNDISDDPIDDIEKQLREITKQLFDAKGVFERLVAEQTRLYDEEQQDFRNDAVKQIDEIMAKTLVAQDTDAYSLESLIEKLESAVKALDSIDELRQRAGGYSRKLHQMTKYIYKDKIADNDKHKEYDNRWKSIYASATQLLDALTKLVNGTQVEDPVVILNRMIVDGEAAVVGLETNEERIERLRKEAEEEGLIAFRTDELQIAKTFFSAPLLATSYEVPWNQVRDYEAALKSGNKIAIFNIPAMLLPVPHSLDDDSSIRETNDYTGVYISDDREENIVQKYWNARVNWLIVFGIDRYEREATIELNRVYGDYQKLFEKQPKRVEFTPLDEDQLVVDVNSKTEAPRMYGGGTLFNRKTQEWADNSCWMDTVFLTLFSIPQTQISQAIFNAKKIVVKKKIGTTLILKDNSQKTVNKRDLPSINCDEAEVKELHDTAITDIAHIQRNDKSDPCPLQSMKHWKNKTTKCLVFANDDSPVEKTNMGEIHIVLESLITFYQLQQMVSIESRMTGPLLYDPQNAHGSCLHVIYTDNALKTNQRPVINDGYGYQLYGMIGHHSQHFVTYLKDFESGRWAYFNLSQETKIREWVTYNNERPQMDGGFEIRALVYMKTTEIDRLLAESDKASASFKTPSALITQWSIPNLKPQDFTEYANTFAKVHKLIDKTNRKDTIVQYPTANANEWCIEKIWNDQGRRQAFGHALALARDTQMNSQMRDEMIRKALFYADPREEYESRGPAQGSNANQGGNTNGNNNQGSKTIQGGNNNLGGTASSLWTLDDPTLMKNWDLVAIRFGLKSALLDRLKRVRIVRTFSKRTEELYVGHVWQDLERRQAFIFAVELAHNSGILNDAENELVHNAFMYADINEPQNNIYSDQMDYLDITSLPNSDGVIDPRLIEIMNDYKNQLMNDPAYKEERKWNIRRELDLEKYK